MPLERLQCLEQKSWRKVNIKNEWTDQESTQKVTGEKKGGGEEEQ